MPIYEYQCTACGHDFEIIQRMSDAPLVDCPACAQPQLRKKLSASAFHLKGSGWYQTDFKGGKKPPVEGGEAAPVKEASKVETKEAGAGKETAAKEVAADTKTASSKTPDSSAA
ncbi:MAG: zinc ribbon domain-containing protein [Gammaproteobacteria bacterium]